MFLSESGEQPRQIDTIEPGREQLGALEQGCDGGRLAVERGQQLQTEEGGDDAVGRLCDGQQGHRRGGNGVLNGACDEVWPRLVGRFSPNRVGLVGIEPTTKGL